MTDVKTSATSCCSKSSCTSAKTTSGSGVDAASATAGVAAAAGAVSAGAGAGVDAGVDAGADAAMGATVELTAEQEIQALRNVHQFLSNFDRVPGFLSNKWAKALDAIAVVANSLIAKNAPATSETDADLAAASTESAESVVTQ
jgi:hypothetical protein